MLVKKKKKNHDFILEKQKLESSLNDIGTDKIPSLFFHVNTVFKRNDFPPAQGSMCFYLDGCG